VLRRALSRVLEALYAYDSVRALKDRLRPIKHALFGPGDVYYVAGTIRRARGAAHPVRVVFDVGAATGDKTLTFLRYFPEAMVYAFEPQTESRRHLERRTAAWGGRVVILDYGLLNENGQAMLRLYSYRDASSLLPIQRFAKDEGKKEIGTEPITLHRLDDCVGELGVTDIDLLKIDVEGVENEVIEGGLATLRDHTWNVFVEISPMRRGPRSGEHVEVFRLLHEVGFTLLGQFGDYWFTRDPAVLDFFFGET